MRRFVFFWICLLLWGYGCGLGAAAENTPRVHQENRLNNLAQKAQSDQEKRLEILNQPDVTALLQETVTRLWAQLASELPVVRVKVIQELLPDATTYPNGVIYITTGMMALTRSEDQLAMILSHEIIHYTQRHTLAAFRRSRSAYSFGSENRDAHSATDAVQVQQDLAQLCDAAEQQADEQGLALMQAAGYCPDEVLPLFAGFQTLTEHVENEYPISSVAPDVLHRRTVRMKALLDHRPDLPSCLVSVPGRQAYLQRIAPVLLSNVRSALEKGFWDQALTAIHRYLSIRADDAYAHFLQGEVESRLSGHTDQAMACYAKAIDLDSAFAPAYRALGVLHLKAGHLQQARRYFETSLALAPQALENGYIRGYLQLCSN